MNFYPKLALTNIEKNKKIYLPYILTSIFTTAMFYIVSSIGNNQGLDSHQTVSAFMDLSQYVIIGLAAVFLFYANSFIIKQRKKEISLYNILGMEKRHIMIMMLVETFITSIISIGIGLIVGILFSQLMFLLLINIMHLTSEFVFSVPVQSVILTVIIFMIIFFLSLIFNLVQVKLSNPIELMRAGNVGEKEPKTKIIMTLIGIISLSIGYYIALSIDDPFSAITLFFVAVVLVIIGTYDLFTAGSIALLKSLKKNKHFYYQTRHFTSVSGMIYRMKQNAVGLANICILCTCVLVTLSSTLCMYTGIEANIKKICPVDEMISTEDKDGERLYEITKRLVVKNHLDVKDFFQLETYETSGIFENNQIVFRNSYDDYTNVTGINFITQEEFNKSFNQNVNLKDNEIILYNDYDFDDKTLSIGDEKFNIKDTFKDKRIMAENGEYYKSTAIIMKNEKMITNIAQKYYNGSFKHNRSVGFNCDDQRAKDVMQEIIDEYCSVEGSHGYSRYSFSMLLSEMYELYGGLLFIGVFLSVMFLIGAILIIYYKQLTEGFEDQKRFEILQNVGMSQKEVKQTIRSQVLAFFFLPLIVAVVHLTFAYSLIRTILEALLIVNSDIYLVTCIGCVLGLAIIYSIVYSLTARTYYQIVKK